MLSCGIIGHRIIENKALTELRFFELAEDLLSKNCRTFNFGSNSEFDCLAWDVISGLQLGCKEIKMVDYYCGKEKPILKENTIEGLRYFDEVVLPKNTINAGKRLYIERNKALIDASDIMIFYFDEDYSPQNSNSGTKIAYEYAKSKNKKIYNLCLKRANIMPFTNKI